MKTREELARENLNLRLEVTHLTAEHQESLKNIVKLKKQIKTDVRVTQLNTKLKRANETIVKIRGIAMRAINEDM